MRGLWPTCPTVLVGRGSKWEAFSPQEVQWGRPLCITVTGHLSYGWLLKGLRPQWNIWCYSSAAHVPLGSSSHQGHQAMGHTPETPAWPFAWWRPTREPVLQPTGLYEAAFHMYGGHTGWETKAVPRASSGKQIKTVWRQKGLFSQILGSGYTRKKSFPKPPKEKYKW